MVENGRKKVHRGYLVGNGFSRVLRHGSRGGPVDNGRKWLKMAEKSSPRLFGRKWIFARFTSWPSRWPGRQWQKWSKMVENEFPRENGGKWISARFPSFPYYLISIGRGVTDTMKTRNDKIL